MTILCHGSTHVYLTGHARCTCGAAANGYPPPAGVAMYGLPVNYNPFSPHAPPKPAADVPLHVFKAAKDDLKAQYLSADGKRAYKEMSDGVRVFYWDDKTRAFGSSFPVEGLPADAVAL